MQLAVGVARTHHKFAWNGLLERVAELAGKTDIGEQVLQLGGGEIMREDGDLPGEVEGRGQAATNDPSSAAAEFGGLHLVPRAFAGTVGREWVWNRLQLSVDGHRDLPRELLPELRKEYFGTVRGILLASWSEDGGAKPSKKKTNRAVRFFDRIFADPEGKSIATAREQDVLRGSKSGTMGRSQTLVPLVISPRKRCSGEEKMWGW